MALDSTRTRPMKHPEHTFEPSHERVIIQQENPNGEIVQLRLNAVTGKMNILKKDGEGHIVEFKDDVVPTDEEASDRIGAIQKYYADVRGIILTDEEAAKVYAATESKAFALGREEDNQTNQ